MSPFTTTVSPGLSTGAALPYRREGPARRGSGWALSPRHLHHPHLMWGGRQTRVGPQYPSTPRVPRTLLVGGVTTYRPPLPNCIKTGCKKMKISKRFVFNITFLLSWSLVHFRPLCRRSSLAPGRPLSVIPNSPVPQRDVYPSDPTVWTTHVMVGGTTPGRVVLVIIDTKKKRHKDYDTVEPRINGSPSTPLFVSPAELGPDLSVSS